MSKADEVKKEVIQSINVPKHRLMEELKKLQSTHGCATAARELGNIIGRLEHWQAKHS